MDIQEAVSAEPVHARHPWELARIEIVDILLRKHASHSVRTAGTVLLDVGCGDAFITNSLAVRHPEPRFVGVDTALDNDTRKIVQNRVNAKNLDLYESLDVWDRCDGCVSAVLLMDVLEHVEKDELFLKGLATDRSVRDDAVFVVTVPAHQDLFSSHDIVLRHRRRYSLRGLTDMATRAGFDVMESGYMFAILMVPRLIGKLVERIVPARKRTESVLTRWRGGKTRTWTGKTLLVADFKLARMLNILGIRIMGLSCYMVCRRSS